MAETEARLVPLYDVLAGAGHGWAENWHPDDGEDGEMIDLNPCAWVCGNTIYGDGSTSDGDCVASWYGRQYGIRYWTGRPTDGQREAVPWVTKEGKDVVGRVR